MINAEHIRVIANRVRAAAADIKVLKAFEAAIGKKMSFKDDPGDNWEYVFQNVKPEKAIAAAGKIKAKKVKSITGFMAGEVATFEIGDWGIFVNKDNVVLVDLLDPHED